MVKFSSKRAKDFLKLLRKLAFPKRKFCEAIASLVRYASWKEGRKEGEKEREKDKDLLANTL